MEGLTDTQIRLLRKSFAQLQPKSGIAGLLFYRNLFTLAPSLRPLFQTNIEIQGRKLMETLEFTVTTLEDPDALVPVLEALGRRHVAYGARDEDYAAVIRALLMTLRETLDRAFTTEVRDAWQAALEFVAGAMQRGAAPTVALKQDLTLFSRCGKDGQTIL